MVWPEIEPEPPWWNLSLAPLEIWHDHLLNLSNVLLSTFFSNVLKILPSASKRPSCTPIQTVGTVQIWFIVIYFLDGNQPASATKLNIIYNQYYLFIVYLATFSVTKTKASNLRVISELYMGKYLDGSGRGIISKVPFHHSLRSTEENHETLSGFPVPGQKFESGTSWLRRRVSHSTTTLAFYQCLTLPLNYT